MATISQSTTWQAKGVLKTTWEGLGNDDDGAPESYKKMSVRTVQVEGTFGAGGTVEIEGSNDGGANWHTLDDDQGNALSFDSAGIANVGVPAELIRPRAHSGDSTTDLDVTLVAVRH